MNLNSMEDLWDNRISIRNAASYPEKTGTATEGSYGFESFYTMNWYQSHNDSGSPDTHSFKRLGQEMLGVAGYENGYMVYMSALSSSDLDALRKITGNPDITWKEYKLGRYRETERQLDQIPYFDRDAVIAQFRAAFEADAVNGNANQSFETKRMLYGIVKRVTGDFSEGGIYQSPPVYSVSSAEELLSLAAQNPYGIYRLEQDIDFSGIAASGGSYLPERFIGILMANGHRSRGEVSSVRRSSVRPGEESDCLCSVLCRGRSGALCGEDKKGDIWKCPGGGRGSVASSCGDKNGRIL